jgi:glycosyltransferase involved in cell wall biosynthesis
MLNAYLMGPGGSNYVMLETAIAFAEKGYEVYVDSIIIKSHRDLLELATFFGIKQSEVVDIKIGEPRCKPLLIINTSGDVFSGTGDVMYIHYPSFLNHTAYYPGLTGISRFLGDLYSLVNASLFPLVKRRVSLFIANSKFTAKFLNEFLSVSPIIINPPVNLDDILEKHVLDFAERERRVITVARISPEKHPELAVYLAYLLKKYKVSIVLAGAFSSYNKPLYDELVELSVKMNVDDCFEIKTNISREELIELYRRSIAYVHITPKEHFGISIVEAMAAGTPVIVPRNSGGWIDIAREDANVAIPYRNLREAKCYIKALLDNPQLWRLLSTNGRTRALELNRRSFREKIYEAVKPILDIKMKKNRDTERMM